MIINVYRQKGVKERDYDENVRPVIKSPGILAKLNSIIDWSKSNFPVKLKDGVDVENQEEVTKPENWIQDSEFLGAEPELKPGDMFKWDSSLYLVNSEDSIILTVSETGILAYERLKDAIESEYELRFCWDILDNFKPEFTSDSPNLEKLVKMKVPSLYMSILRDKLGEEIEKHITSEPFCKIELKNVIEDYDFPINLYTNKFSIFYDEDEMNEHSSNLFFKSLLSWCLVN